jgi:hypothetical protein
MPAKRVLSKSRIMNGMQCPKYLYLSIFRPELQDAPDSSREQVMEMGNRVGELAREEFPGGVLIEGDYQDLAGYLAKTQAAIIGGAKVLYEAAFQWKQFFFRADILKKAPGGKWDVHEVKSSTKVKEQHLLDLAVQKVICQDSGISIRRTYLMHINNKCRHPDLSNLFQEEDVTKEVDSHLPEVKKEMLALAKLIASNEEPEHEIGPHCTDPYPCAFQGHCWKKIPTPSIWDIPSLKQWTYYEQGKIRIPQIQQLKLPPLASRAVEAHIKGERHLNKEEMRTRLKDWKWPLISLDFETISYAIPEVNGTGPYENIPFQLACSIWPGPKEKPVVADFLDTESADPTAGLTAHLVAHIPQKGSVVAYNMSFEGNVLKRLAERFPRHKKALLSIADRLVDPWPVIKAAVYYPEFGSSFGLKSVAPAILGQKAGYEEMGVGDGNAAQRAYMYLRDPKNPEEERKRLRKGLIAYCRKDADVCLSLVKWMCQQCGMLR